MEQQQGFDQNKGQKVAFLFLRAYNKYQAKWKGKPCALFVDLSAAFDHMFKSIKIGYLRNLTQN